MGYVRMDGWMVDGVNGDARLLALTWKIGTRI